MTAASSSRTFDVRHVQLARAAFAAIAAVMITFSPDHSAGVGMAVFSGFTIATGLALLLAVWLVYPVGARWPAAALGVITLVAGMVGGLTPLRSPIGFFATVIAWAILTGLVELISGWQGLRGRTERREIAPGVVDARPAPRPVPRSEARDALVVGALTLIFGVAMLFVQPDYALDYTIEEAHQTFTLTGVTIGVGVFGGYAAIVAVYLAIAGFSPRTPVITAAPAERAAADRPAPAGPADQKDPA